jgi:hypothetical protein
MNLSPVPSLKTLDNEKTAANLKGLFHEAQEGVKRIAYFGFLALHVKTVELEHGQFLPWLAAYCPELSRQTVASHIQLARTVLQAMAIRPWKIRSNVKQLDISHYGDLLSAAEKDLNEAAKDSRKKMLEIIEGKSARQLMAKYKQAQAEPADPKVRQRYVCGGRGRCEGQPPAQGWGKDRLAALEGEIEHWAAWADRHVSVKELSEVSGRHQELLGRLHALLDDYLRQYAAFLARARAPG